MRGGDSEPTAPESSTACSGLFAYWHADCAPGAVYQLIDLGWCRLGGADARDGDLLEHVRGGDSAVGVAGGAGLELGRAERPAERAGGLPDGHVDEGRAAGGAAMELGGDEAGLLLHVCGVVGPNLQETLDVAGCQVELVDQGRPGRRLPAVAAHR